MAVIHLLKPGSNTEDIGAPMPVGPTDPYKDTEAGIDFVKKVVDTGEFGRLSTVGGDIVKDTPLSLPEFVGTVTSFEFETASYGISVEDVSIDAEALAGRLDTFFWVDFLSGDDVVIGSDGADALSSYDGDDQLFGGAGRDSLAGGRGDDALFGGKGGDVLYAGDGEDGLFGGRGRDDIQIRDGVSYAETGRGADTVTLFSGLGRFPIDGGETTIADFSVEQDGIKLFLGPQLFPTVEELIKDGTLKIKGDEFHTVLRFGESRADLLGVSIDDFNLDLLSVIG